MAIAFDAASTKTSTIAASSFSWSHTCTGSNRLLVVGIVLSSSTNSVTSATYNSVAMTQRLAVNMGSDLRLEIWSIVAPATGTNTIAVNLASNGVLQAGATSWTDIHQTTPHGDTAYTTGTGTSPSQSVAAGSNDVVLDALALNDINGTVVATVGAGQTQRYNVTGGPTNSYTAAGSSEPGAASVTMSWSLDASVEYALGLIVLRARSSGAVTQPAGMLLGGFVG